MNIIKILVEKLRQVCELKIYWNSKLNCLNIGPHVVLPVALLFGFVWFFFFFFFERERERIVHGEMNNEDEQVLVVKLENVCEVRIYGNK